MNIGIKVADQAWIATALLHRENPGRQDFKLREIIERAAREFGFPRNMRKGVWQHIVGHSVASNPPTPARHRMLTKTGRGRRRLFRDGDAVSADRDGKTTPAAEDIPTKYHPLLAWYQAEYNRNGMKTRCSAGDSSPAAFLEFVGLIPAYDLKVMEEIIERECERIEDEGNKDGAGKDAA